MEHVAGADLHKRVTQLALLRDERPALQARFPNDRASVERALSRLPAGTTIAVESMGSWWWFVDTARRLGHDVVLSHPKLTKAIAAARLKSDKVDAVMLARVLKADLLPLVWIPRERDRHIRELLAHRGRIVRARTAVINELHAVYGKRNLEVPRALWHRHQPAPWRPDELGGYGPRIVDEDVALLKALNEQISGLDKALKGVAQEDRHYLGVLKRRGKKIGRIAAANKLLGVLFQMMKQGLTYEELHQRGGSTQ